MKNINRKLQIITRHFFLYCLVIFLLFYVILKLYINGVYYNYALLFLLGLYLGNEFAIKVNVFSEE